MSQDGLGIQNIDATLAPHWHGRSEKYAGGDSLLWAFDQGWTIRRIYRQEYQAHSRSTIVYRFVLELDRKLIIMAVVNNPFIERLAAEFLSQTVTVRESSSTVSEVVRHKER
jgi:hypothetical protein